MLNLANSGVKEQGALLNLGLLIDELLHLLSEEIVLVDVHILELAEIVLKVYDVLHYLLQRLIIKFDCLMFEGRELTPQ